MHWSGYVLLVLLVLAVALAIHIWQRYRLYRRAWQDSHLHEIVHALEVLKIEQLSTLRIVKEIPSAFTTSLGVTLGYAISVVDAGDNERIRHHLVSQSAGFFGQVLAERVLTFALERLGFSPERVELCITAYSFDSFHAFIDLEPDEQNEWARASLLPLPAEHSALDRARQYRDKLGHPRQLVNPASGLPGIS